MERVNLGGLGYENGGVMMTRDPKPRLRWTADLHDRFVDAVAKLGGADRSSYVHFDNCSQGGISNESRFDNHLRQSGNVPFADTLRHQVDAQQRFQEQLEVQKKLQMRMEAQGKYLLTLLEKAQKSMPCGGNGAETDKGQFSDFNLALSGLVGNDHKNNKAGLITNISHVNGDLTDNFRLCGEIDTGETEDACVKPESGFVHFDLNSKDGYDLLNSGKYGIEMKPNVIADRHQ